MLKDDGLIKGVHVHKFSQTNHRAIGEIFTFIH